MDKRICKNCKQIKVLEDFDKQKNGRFGRRANCKICRKYMEYESQKDNILYKRKLYYNNNKDKINQYNQHNKEKINKNKREKLKNNINFKLSERLRNRISVAIRGIGIKRGSAIRDLGCSIEEFKLYLESKFLDGMTWENYGYYGWHIDHIIPLASFDLTNENDFKKACHYTNLQPLWRIDNQSKSDKI